MTHKGSLIVERQTSLHIHDTRPSTWKVKTFVRIVPRLFFLSALVDMGHVGIRLRNQNTAWKSGKASREERRKEDYQQPLWYCMGNKEGENAREISINRGRADGNAHIVISLCQGCLVGCFCFTKLLNFLRISWSWHWIFREKYPSLSNFKRGVIYPCLSNKLYLHTIFTKFKFISLWYNSRVLNSVLGNSEHISETSFGLNLNRTKTGEKR